MTALSVPLRRVLRPLASLGPRERIALAVGAAALLGVPAYLARPSAPEPMPAPVELPPVPPPPPAAPMPQPARPPVPSASLSGLVLHGVIGGGPGGGTAIIAVPGGAQRAVRVGRQILPGVMLKAVAIRHVLLATPSGDMRLAFDKPAVAEAPAASPPEAAGADRRQRETLEFRTGLKPVRDGDRISGFAIRPGARLPLLERAGLRAGDVIVAVNGQAMRSEEKVLELSEEIATAYTAEFDYLRDGRPMKAKMEVNKQK